jgi:uncharacterized protein GlcG (DUF336 family)
MARDRYVTRNTPRLALQGARLILAAAIRRATQLAVPMDIAVVDDAAEERRAARFLDAPGGPRLHWLSR